MAAPEPTVGLLVRRARVEDAAAIREIFNEGVQDGLATYETAPRSLDEQRRLLAEAARDPKHAILVGEMGRWVLGWAALSPLDSRTALEGVGEVTVFVRRSFRKHGVGKQLMRAIQQGAQRLGYRKLVGSVLADNADSLRLCRATGFREAGRHEKHATIEGTQRNVVLVEYLIPTSSSLSG